MTEPAAPQRELPPPSNLTDPGEFNKYATDNRLERWLVANFLRKVREALPERPVRRVLEIGIGEGHVSEKVAAEYPEATVVGIDLPHPGMAERWQSRGVPGIFADAVRLPFREASFDLVLAVEVMEHLPDPHSALREIARVASADVVLSVPLEPLWRIGNMLRGRYLADLGNTPDHVQHWGRRSFHRFVTSQLQVKAIRQPLPWTLVVAAPR